MLWAIAVYSHPMLRFKIKRLVLIITSDIPVAYNSHDAIERRIHTSSNVIDMRAKRESPQMKLQQM